MATDSSSTNIVTTTTTAISSNSPNSPQLRRNVKTVSSQPWTQIVRGGGESEVIASSAAVASASPPSPVADQATVVTAAEEESVENGNAARRPVWNKPSNGEIGPVMGAELWPDLSESARASSKSSSGSLKGLSDGSTSQSASQGIVTSSSSSQKQVSNIAIPNSTPNNTVPVRQRSMKRNSTNTSVNGGTPQSLGSQGQSGEVHANNPSPRDHLQRSFQSRAANDQTQQQRNSFRNRNGGSHNNNHGGRRDQERTNQDWNNHRNFNGRDTHIQTQRGHPRFIRHPPPPPPLPSTSTPFIPPPSVRPYGTPMGFPAPVYYVAGPPESLGGLPFVAAPIPPHAMFFPPPDFQLHSKILNQIEYYFSSENLIKDTYLRQKMDDQGWVSINLIAGFNKVAQLTDSIPLILDAIRSSSIIEVQGDKVRRRNDWMKWVMPPMRFPNASSSQSFGNPSHEMLAVNVQHLSLEENASHSSAQTESDVNSNAYLPRPSSGNFVNHSESSKSEEASQVTTQGDADLTATNTRN